MPDGTLSQSELDSDTQSIVCDCPTQIVSRTLSRAVFTGLDHNEQYFPMVARSDHSSFFATPPFPVAPLAFVAPSFPDPSDGDHPELAVEGVNSNNVPNVPEDIDATHQGMERVQREAPEIDVNPPGSDFSTQNALKSQSPSLRAIESIPDEVDALPLFEQDQDYWQQWHAEELPRAFSRLFMHRERNNLVRGASSKCEQQLGRLILTNRSGPSTLWRALSGLTWALNLCKASMLSSALKGRTRRNISSSSTRSLNAQRTLKSAARVCWPPSIRNSRRLIQFASSSLGRMRMISRIARNCCSILRTLEKWARATMLNSFS